MTDYFAWAAVFFTVLVVVCWVGLLYVTYKERRESLEEHERQMDELERP